MTIIWQREYPCYWAWTQTPNDDGIGLLPYGVWGPDRPGERYRVVRSEDGATADGNPADEHAGERTLPEAKRAAMMLNDEAL